MATSKFKIQQFISPTTLKEVLIVKGIKEVLRTYKSTLDLNNKKHTSALYTQVLNIHKYLTTVQHDIVLVSLGLYGT